MNPLSTRHTRLNQLAEENPGLTYEDILKMESLSYGSGLCGRIEGADAQNQTKRRYNDMNKLQYRTEGSYNILDSRDKSAQYVFKLRQGAPKELQRSFLIDIEKDGNFSGTALDVAYEIQTVIDSYWVNTDKPRIKALVEYLEMWSEKDEYDELKAERESLTKRLAEVENKLGGFDPEEWENWKPQAPESTEQLNEV